GDKLIFRILDSGDYLKDVPEELLSARASGKAARHLAEKALRYDLTVPFARFVVMNQHALAFPFKRYQIQPVWRADRPQKGRYREFYQCDADVVGSKSLIYEVEFVQLFDAVLTELKVPAVIHINHRQILMGIAEVMGASDRMMEMTIAIDKLDKIGMEGVVKELAERGFQAEQLQKLSDIVALSQQGMQALDALKVMFETSASGLRGIQEITWIFERVNALGLAGSELALDLTLARGLNYYTGAIFEVKAKGVSMGSICGGGRYDDLTGIFGLKDVSGIGISFGADRIYDVMNELQLFPPEALISTQVLFANFGDDEAATCMGYMSTLREMGARCELYPDAAKMKKQFKYADDKGIPFVAIIGTEEMQQGTIQWKNMKTGEQQLVNIDTIAAMLTQGFV
ncbi:MAG: histidine--tRNA ligase, partial [Flavobacteriales bacterium]